MNVRLLSAEISYVEQLTEDHAGFTRSNPLLRLKKWLRFVFEIDENLLNLMDWRDWSVRRAFFHIDYPWTDTLQCSISTTPATIILSIAFVVIECQRTANRFRILFRKIVNFQKHLEEIDTFAGRRLSRYTAQHEGALVCFFPPKKCSIIGMKKILLLQSSRERSGLSAHPLPIKQRVFYRVNEEKLHKFHSTVIQSQQQRILENEHDSSSDRSVQTRSQGEQGKAWLNSSEARWFTLESSKSMETSDSRSTFSSTMSRRRSLSNSSNTEEFNSGEMALSYLTGRDHTIHDSSPEKFRNCRLYVRSIVRHMLIDQTSDEESSENHWLKNGISSLSSIARRNKVHREGSSPCGLFNRSQKRRSARRNSRRRRAAVHWQNPMSLVFACSAELSSSVIHSFVDRSRWQSVQQGRKGSS